MKIKGYIGTYASDYSEGIYSFSFDEMTGEVSDKALYSAMKDAKYVSLYQNFMAAPCIDKQAGVCFFKAGSKPSHRQILYQEEVAACHIMQDETYIYTANYHDGNVMIYKKLDGALLFYKRLDIQQHGGCHQIILQGHYLLVPCLLLDILRIYDCNRDFAWIRDVPFVKGTGPRHAVFSNDGLYLFLVSERSNEVFMFQSNNEMELTLLQRLPLLNEGETGASAAIRLTRDERFLYVSTRDRNIISALECKDHKMQIIQQVSCGGEHPRDMILSNDERFVLVMNRSSHNLIVFQRNEINGKIGKIVSEMEIQEGVSVLLSPRKEL